SRQENASNQESGVPFRFNRNGKGSGRAASRLEKRGIVERLDHGVDHVRVKKTRQIKNPESRFDSIETEKALEGRPHGLKNAGSLSALIMVSTMSAAAWSSRSSRSSHILRRLARIGAFSEGSRSIRVRA